MIKLDKTIDIYDSSKLKCVMSCERKYYFNYIRGLVSVYPNHNLIYGEAFHRAKEVVFKEGFTKAALDKGMELFDKYYRQFFNEETDIDYSPKDPGNAYRALINYIDNYQDDYDVIATEVGGSVPLLGDSKITFRFDVVANYQGSTIFVDHKTSKVNSQVYDDAYDNDFQMKCYTYALGLNYTDAKGGIIEKTVLQKKSCDTHRKRVIYSTDVLEEWACRASSLISDIKQQIEAIEDNIDDRILMLFGKRETSCVAYNQLCPYFHLCNAWSNPLHHEEVPEGFKVSFWNPLEREE